MRHWLIVQDIQSPDEMLKTYNNAEAFLYTAPLFVHIIRNLVTRFQANKKRATMLVLFHRTLPDFPMGCQIILHFMNACLLPSFICAMNGNGCAKRR
jgi:hypothetical protein